MEYGVTEFIVGHYGGFDRLAASAVKEAKRFYPEVKLILLLPYHPAERPISTPGGFDGTFYPPGMESVPRKIAIVRANRYVVDHVDYLIAYAWHPASNARELVEYAKRRDCQNRLQIMMLERLKMLKKIMLKEVQESSPMKEQRIAYQLFHMMKKIS